MADWKYSCLGMLLLTLNEDSKSAILEEQMRLCGYQLSSQLIIFLFLKKNFLYLAEEKHRWFSFNLKTF